MNKTIKKTRIATLALCLMLLLCGCEDNSSEVTKDNKTIEDNAGINIPDDISLEELNEVIEQDSETVMTMLVTEFETLKTDIDTYDKYKKNVGNVEAFYEHVYEETQLLCIRMREYSLAYAKLIVSSDMSTDDMYDEAKEIYDRIYDDVGSEIYDEIYDGILAEMYDCYYDGIIEDVYDAIEYDEWSDARSDEYDWWSDTRSDVYDDYSDVRSDIYDFYSDLRSDLWDEDMEKVNEEIEEFQEDINDLKE